MLGQLQPQKTSRGSQINAWVGFLGNGSIPSPSHQLCSKDPRAGACINCSSFSLDGNTCLPFGDSQERATAPHTQQNKILVLEICSRELPKARLWENLCPGLIWACPSIPAQGLLQLCEKGGAQREQGVLCCQIHPSAEQDQVSSPSGEGYPCLSVPRQNYQAPG